MPQNQFYATKKFFALIFFIYQFLLTAVAVATTSDNDNECMTEYLLANEM